MAISSARLFSSAARRVCSSASLWGCTAEYAEKPRKPSLVNLDGGLEDLRVTISVVAKVIIVAGSYPPPLVLYSSTRGLTLAPIIVELKRRRDFLQAAMPAKAPPLSLVHTRPSAKLYKALVNIQPQNVAMSSPTKRRSGTKFAAGAPSGSGPSGKSRSSACWPSRTFWGSFVVFAISKVDKASEKHTAGYPFIIVIVTHVNFSASCARSLWSRPGTRTHIKHHCNLTC